MHLLFASQEEAQSAVPRNQIRKIRIDNQIFCLAHTSEGFVAFAKECPHLQDDLSKGNLNHQMEIVCPWHSYRFNLVNGEECQQRCAALKIHKTEWVNNQLFVIF